MDEAWWRLLDRCLNARDESSTALTAGWSRSTEVEHRKSEELRASEVSGSSEVSTAIKCEG